MATNNSINTPYLVADGQLLIGQTGGRPVNATLTAGAGISITNGAGAITIAATGVEAWVEVTGTTQTIAANTNYIANNAAPVVFTLPATAAVGDTFTITGKGAGGWQIAQNAGQTIYFGDVATTTGTGGSLESTEDRDTVTIVCVTADDDFNVTASIGNITYV